MGETLKEKYTPYFKMGVAFGGWDLKDKTELIKTHFNSVTCANEMKMGSLTREPGVYNFERADAIVNFARENGMEVHGHNLVWHNQTANYIFEGNPSKEEVLEALRAHCVKVTEHFGQLRTFDAVNEAIEDKTDTFYRDTQWYRAMGDGYITDIFKVIHEVMPETDLYYNDYNECVPEKRAKIMKLIKEMQAEGAPIAGMGMQMHHNIYSPTLDEVKRSIEDYASLGLKIRVSELDVSLFKWGDESHIIWPNPELAKKQADYYGGLFAIFREYHKHIDAVTFWGVTDKDSWLNNFPVWNRRNYPMLFDDDMQPKEAFYKVMDF